MCPDPSRSYGRVLRPVPDLPEGPLTRPGTLRGPHDPSWTSLRVPCLGPPRVSLNPSRTSPMVPRSVLDVP